jgi:hypothetical protein
MAYVYRHIRLDKNEPFYIGVGSDNSYKRSRQKYGRSKHWADIAKNGYEIDIIIDDVSYEYALIKETEFIKLYGRKDIGFGTLCNFTDGGEGFVGGKLSEEAKKLISIKSKKAMANRPEGLTALYLKKAINSPKLKEYYLSRRGQSWHKHNEQSKLKISESHKGLKQSKETIEKKSKKIVQSTLNGEFIKIWSSARNVQRELKLSQGNISKCCSGQYGQAYGFKWEYLNKNK